jgi:hypothetical protein
MFTDMTTQLRLMGACDMLHRHHIDVRTMTPLSAEPTVPEQYDQVDAFWLNQAGSAAIVDTLDKS